MRICDSNYAATVVEIKVLQPIANCDNVHHALIFGDLVVVGKDVQVGDVGIHFATETQLSTEYLTNNNLYRHSENNADKTKKGFFEDNGRVRCVKFRGNESMGFFMPIESIEYTDKKVKIGDRFEKLGGHDICTKYVSVNAAKQQGQQNQNLKKKKKKKPSRIIPTQFRLHKSTGRFGQNTHQFDACDVISISKKYHGTSAVFSRVLCNKKLSWIERMARKFGAAVKTTEYDHVYSSRRSIKSNPKEGANSFYKHDIWTEVFNEIKDVLADGISVYGEIVGYAGTKLVQKGYDYGCKPGEHKLCVYRVTQTAADGTVYEFSPLQMREWCDVRGLDTVEVFFEGRIQDMIPGPNSEIRNLLTGDDLLAEIQQWPGMGKMDVECTQSVPFEGFVVRNVGHTLKSFKIKSLLFCERETKNIDAGETDPEDDA